MMPLDDYESLSREERLHRVCALLSKAVTFACIREQAVNRETSPIPMTGDKPGPEVTVEAENGKDLQSGDLELFLEIHRWGEISPHDATRLWGVSRATAHRWLSRLEKAGWISKQGATKATRYFLADQAAVLLLQMKLVQPSDDSLQGGRLRPAKTSLSQPSVNG